MTRNEKPSGPIHLGRLDGRRRPSPHKLIPKKKRPGRNRAAMSARAVRGRKAFQKVSRSENCPNRRSSWFPPSAMLFKPPPLSAITGNGVLIVPGVLLTESADSFTYRLW